MNFALIQGIGFIALLIGIITYQFNKRKSILLMQVIYNMLYGIQYFLLGSLNSMFMCIFGAARNIVFYNDSKFSSETRNFIFGFFITITIVTTILDFNGILSVLSCIGAVFSVTAVWQVKERNLRMFSFMSSTVWLVHDIIIGSYAAILDTTILTVSIAIAIYRFDIKNGGNADVPKEQGKYS